MKLYSMVEVENCLEGLYAVSRAAPEQRLEAVRAALQVLGNPQNSIPAIHVAGTSGKGSTSYYAAAMLREAGYAVGLAVSPHVHTVRERSQVNGAPLPEDEYVGYFSEFVSIVNENQWVLSYIEFLTIFTFWLFARLQLNYMVIEVGLGGRLDPTNTMTGRATVRVITDIGLDHTEILGETLPAIAREKSGIIHDDDTVVMHQQDAAVMDVVREAVEGRAAVLRVVTTDSLTAPLPMFQQRNWTLAKAAVAARLELDGVDPLSRSQAEVTLSLMIPGRFEIRMHQGVTVVLDAAHNEQKIAALTESVRAAYPATLAYYVVALGENKMNQAEAIIAHIERDADVTVTRFTTQAVRGEIAPEALAEFGSKVRSIEDPYDAFGVALQDARDHSGIVVVTGSFYLVDGIRERLTAAEKNNLL